MIDLNTFDARSVDLQTLDWEALARPDSMGQGARLARRLADRWSGPWSGETRLGGPRPGEPTLFDGAIALRHARPHCHLLRYHNGDLLHPNIARAEALVRRWPAGFQLVREAVEVFNPITDDTIPEANYGKTLGSSSYFDRHCLGLVFATYYDAFGLAQALIHEAAHQKLFGLGLRIATTGHILTNPQVKLYISPVVIDRKRPMSAVLHAQFSFMHVTKLDLILLESATDPREVEVARLFLARNVRRMESGFATLEKHARADGIGKRFLRGFMSWSRQVLDRATGQLSRTRSSP